MLSLPVTRASSSQGPAEENEKTLKLGSSRAGLIADGSSANNGGSSPRRHVQAVFGDKGDNVEALCQMALALVYSPVVGGDESTTDTRSGASAPWETWVSLVGNAKAIPASANPRLIRRFTRSLKSTKSQ